MASLEVQYRQALQALEAGNNQRALSLLNEILAEDSFYVDAWVAKAKALPDGDEKLDVLEQVLLLDPDNDYANEERARLLNLPSPAAAKEAAAEAAMPIKKMFAATASSEIAPGIPRRWALLAGVGLSIYTLLICGITLAVISASNANRTQLAAQQATSVAESTQRAAAFTATVQSVTEAANLTATALASITPTATPEPSATPTPTLTPIGAEVRTAPPPRDDTPGTIIAWGGFNPNPSSEGYANLRFYTVATGSVETVDDEVVRNVTADLTGDRLVYMWWTRFQEPGMLDPSTTNELGDPLDLSVYVSGLNLATELDHPSVSANGQILAFTGIAANGTREIFYYSYADERIVQVTSDNQEYQDVNISADGSRIAAIRQTPNGVDLISIDVSAITDPGTYPVTVLTNDGNATIESDPYFSPIGAALAYVARGEGSEQGDIFSVNVENGDLTQITASETDEVQPVYSPTGRYVAYAANPQGVYNIFIFDTLTSVTYQLTVEDSDPVYPGAWIES